MGKKKWTKADQKKAANALKASALRDKGKTLEEREKALKKAQKKRRSKK